MISCSARAIGACSPNRVKVLIDGDSQHLDDGEAVDAHAEAGLIEPVSVAWWGRRR
jgi:hypothetical protein